MGVRGTSPEIGAPSWDAGSWFGAQVGGSLWMALAAGALAPAAPGAALAVLACFLAVNALGLAIWRRRERLDVLRSSRALLLALGVASILALAAAQASGEWSRLEVGGRVPPALAHALVVAITTTTWLILGRRHRR